jgi:hypothetical protein
MQNPVLVLLVIGVESIAGSKFQHTQILDMNHTLFPETNIIDTRAL